MVPLGFDYHNVLSNNEGDYGTLVAQLYATKITNLSPHPGFFEDEDDWELVTRIFNFNYTDVGRTLPNIKVGHIELPYGIEYRINTNGTLRQYNHGVNLGPKADWGIGLNKQFSDLEYEFTLTTGGGQEFNQNQAYQFAGYVGTPSNQNQQIGVSFYQSELKGNRKQSIAIDGALYRGLLASFIEVQIGEVNDNPYHQVFVEVNRTSMDESALIYGQLRYQDNDTKTQRKDAILGFSLQMTPTSEVSVQFERRFNVPISIMQAQLRWRF